MSWSSLTIYYNGISSGQRRD